MEISKLWWRDHGITEGPTTTYQNHAWFKTKKWFESEEGTALRCYSHQKLCKWSAKMEIKSSGSNRSHQDKLLKSFQSFSTIVRRTTISTTTIVRKTLTKLPAAFLGNFSNIGGGGGGGGGEGGGGGMVEGKDGFEKSEESSFCCQPSPSPPTRPPKPHPGQKVGYVEAQRNK